MYAQFNSKHSNIAKRILSKSKPNKDYIPELKIYWPAKNRDEICVWKPGYKTIKTVSVEMKDGNRASFRSSQREVKTSYFRYYPKYNAIECGMLVINGLRKKPDEVRNWEFHPDNETYPHFMIFFGDPCPYGLDGNEVLPNPKDRYYNTKIYHLLCTVYTRTQELNKKVAIKHKSISEFFTRNNVILCYQWSASAWNFAENYYKKYAPRPMTQKKLKIIEINDSLKEKEIKDIIPTNATAKFLSDIAWCESANGCAIIRCFSARKSHSSSIYRREFIRFYIAPDKTITIFRKQQYYNYAIADYEGEYRWEKVNGSVFSYINEGYKYDLRNLESVVNLPQFEYLSHAFNPNDKGLTNLTAVFSMLLHPIIEQLYKAGYPELTKICLDNILNRNIKKLFGDDITEKKSLTLYQNLGVNRVILKKMEEVANHHNRDKTPEFAYNILPVVKEFCGCDIRTLDVKSLNDWIDFSQEFRGSVAHVYMQYTSLYKIAGRNIWCFNISNLTEEQKEGYRKEIKRLFRLWRKEHLTTGCNVVLIWKDIINQLRTMNSEFAPQNISLLSMRNYQDLADTHDYLIAYANSIRRMPLDKQEQSKKFKKIQEIRKEHYEVIDDNFSVLVPEHLNQIADEGIALHHCVKTYTGSVASGETTILFLRRSNAKETPFYTIEVKNGVIIQIHGFGNKWIGNDLDAARFMYRYCKDKSVRCDMDILTNKSQGYSVSRRNHWEPKDIINN